jgi:hypothetical protein
MTLVFSTAQKDIQSIQLASHLNNDPGDVATFNAHPFNRRSTCNWHLNFRSSSSSLG